jgi:protein FAM50
MDRFASSSSDRADSSGNARFTSQAATAEDLLKAQTVGLVNLNDYRKRRAEALDRKERGDTAISSGENTPTDGYGHSYAVIGCSLICKVQGIDAKTRFQEEAQSSR